MRTKLLALCVAVIGLGSFAVSEAGAREVTPAQTALPAVARVNEISVSVNSGDGYRSRRYRHGSRRSYGRYHRVRRVYYRHGHRYVTYSRVRY